MHASLWPADAVRPSTSPRRPRPKLAFKSARVLRALCQAFRSGATCAHCLRVLAAIQVNSVVLQLASDSRAGRLLIERGGRRRRAHRLKRGARRVSEPERQRPHVTADTGSFVDRSFFGYVSSGSSISHPSSDLKPGCVCTKSPAGRARVHGRDRDAVRLRACGRKIGRPASASRKACFVHKSVCGVGATSRCCLRCRAPARARRCRKRGRSRGDLPAARCPPRRTCRRCRRASARHRRWRT